MTPVVLNVGLPWDHPIIAQGGHDVEKIRQGLAALDGQMREAGYEFVPCFMGPEDGVTPMAEKLKSRHYDGMIIGFGVRGNKELTPWFEAIVNTCRELSPKTKFIFNWSPESTVEAVQRNL